MQASSTLPARHFPCCNCYDRLFVTFAASAHLMPTRSSRESGMSTKFPEITSSRTRRVLRAGQAGNMSRMPSRSLKASSTSQPPSETGSRVSLFTIPPPTSPEDARVVAIAAARAHADLSRAAAAADPTPSRPGPGADGAAPSTCSTLSMPTPEKTPREYQSAIASKCERENTLVVLPTGAGKTMVAAEVIKRHPPRAVFLVPTKILAEQQARALRGWTGLHVVSFKGGDELPRTTFDVLVATAGAFVASQKKQLPLFQWSLFRVVIFDEVRMKPRFVLMKMIQAAGGGRARIARRTLRDIGHARIFHFSRQCPPSQIVAKTAKRC